MLAVKSFSKNQFFQRPILFTDLQVRLNFSTTLLFKLPIKKFINHMTENIQLDYDAFLRSFKRDVDVLHSFLPDAFIS
jgi:hypothetical protein